MSILKEIHRLLCKIMKSKNIVNTEFTIDLLHGIAPTLRNHTSLSYAKNTSIKKKKTCILNSSLGSNYPTQSFGDKNSEK